ncbi:MAG: YraN family protein [Candidatus Manganitrophaceae bacterium]
MKGKEGEDIAARFLTSRGYRIVERNYRTPLGEIDLIAHDGDVLVFVEVKSRSDSRFGSPQSAVDLRKQSKLTRVALTYLSRMKRDPKACRFDVVSIVGGSVGAFTIEHFTNAFEELEAGKRC